MKYFHDLLKKNYYRIVLLTMVLIFCTLFFAPLPIERDNLTLPFIQNIPFVLPPLKKIHPNVILPLRWQMPDMERMKREGCVADGLLNNYNDPKRDIALVQNSACYYFHRALETWRAPPDFAETQKIIQKIGRHDALYSMFIAEAISTNAKYRYRAKNRDFDFKEMCKKWSKNFWGEHTCKPSFSKKEYQAYIHQITHDAMDSGIHVFIFGQIHHQEKNTDSPKVDNIIREMRAYAKSKNMDILIGAQTGDITDDDYLAFFDFIEGGVGVRADGIIEEGPCYSRYWKESGDWCWPLMWHARFKDHAKDVLIYMDWNGQINDDMHIFSQMSMPARHKYLTDLSTYFADKNIGFLYPLITPLPRDGGGCHGAHKRFYSPDMHYTCKDFDTINNLIRAQKK